MGKFKNKYRISSARWRDWDYSQPGLYFITICTRNRINFFGEIFNDEMHLNEIGSIADRFWVDIPNHFKGVELGEHIIMPNHVHGIIIINPVETGHALSLHPQLPQTIETRHALPLHPRFRNQGKSTISAMVGSFKSAVSKFAHFIDPNFGCQSRFHDHVIRSQEEYIRISNYIIQNPANWNEDKFFNPPM